jgi:predicted TIM-barrel enzyme
MFHTTDRAATQLRNFLRGATVVTGVATGGGKEPDVIRGLTITTALDELAVWVESGARYEGTEGGWIKFAAGDAAISFRAIC